MESGERYSIRRGVVSKTFTSGRANTIKEPCRPAISGFPLSLSIERNYQQQDQEYTDIINNINIIIIDGR
jgi:hypothetical protein